MSETIARKPSILLTIIITFGLTWAQPNEQVRNDFHHFFDSIGKNDVHQIGIYRNILGEEASEGQQAFDTMKEELLEEAWRKNVDRQTNLSSMNANIGLNAVPSKREILDENREPVRKDSTQPHSANHELGTTSEAGSRLTTVPSGSKSSLNEEAKTKFRDMPSPFQEFTEIQEEGRNYIDKTSFIRKLFDERKGRPQVYLFTRPLGFGKMTFLTMLKDFLEGKKDNFNATEIQSRGNNIVEDGKWKSYPVIDINFDLIPSYEAKDFRANLLNRLQCIAKDNGLPLPHGRKRWTISSLINQLHLRTGLPVSILIGNYDEPIRDRYYTGRRKTQNRLVKEHLINFYSEIKSSSDKLRLVFIMGVFRFNDFRGVWNGFVTDITYDDDYWSMLGFTWEEIKFNCGPNIEKFANDTSAAESEVQDKLPRLFGLYSFSPKMRRCLLSPDSLCATLNRKKLSLSLPTTRAFRSAVEQMKRLNITVDEYKYYEMDAAYLDDNFTLHEADNIPLPIYMLCHGFLTISKECFPESGKIVLTYANLKIEEAFRDELETNCGYLSEPSKQTLVSVVNKALGSSDIQTIVDHLNAHDFSSAAASAWESIYNVLKSTFRVECMEGSRFFKKLDGSKADGNVDVFIPPFQETRKGYAISVESELGAVAALFKAIIYIVENPNTFRSAINSTDPILLVGLNVHRAKNSDSLSIYLSKSYPGIFNSINEWVTVPYREGKIWLDELEVCITRNRDEVLQNLQSRLQNRSTDVAGFVPDGVIVGASETLNDKA